MADEQPDAPSATTREVGGYQLGPAIGAGGMGIVHAASMPGSDRKVAVKLMRREVGEQRFMREVRALAGLHHPAIVEYIDHGLAADGRPYLVMEWLAGEDLAARLQRGVLSPDECVALARRLAGALVAAHARGVLHRDIKPSNVLLPDGDVAEAKLLDFGIARVLGSESVQTDTGALIGTVGFMAPEQARGEPNIDGRADLYSLGCLLYQCLTGEPLFTGIHPVAVLAKVLLEEAPSVRSRRPAVPQALDDLVAGLLAKDRAGRPPDAPALAEALRSLALDAAPPAAEAARDDSGAGVTLAEQRVFCLLLLRLRQPTFDPLADTEVGDQAKLDTFTRAAATFGATFSPMLGGYGLISVQLDGPAGDVAVQVARCALAIRLQQPGVAQVLATGRGQRSGTSVVGRVVDAAIAIEHDAMNGAIILDEATAGLLSGLFEVSRNDGVVLLGRERDDPAGRQLLGRATPFVGRARELAWLEGLVREAIEESRSSAALVLAGPGVGKSRLRHEFVRTLQDRADGPLILLGRGGLMTRGAALGVLRPAIRREVGAAEGDSPAQQQAKLQARVAATVPARDCPRIAGFLGEICGLQFPDEHHPALALARRDAIVMADATRVAWLDWLRAECQRRPVLLVLEDLHWGDAASVAFVEVALRELAALPFIVIALARPELHAEFPRLWSDARLSALTLPPISPRSSELLARHVLGADADARAIQTMVARAEGNPFVLEELLRAFTVGNVAQLPDTVLGIVQTRVQALDDETRRCLRAASVFGDGFTEPALAAVVGLPLAAVRARVTTLVHLEFLTREVRPDTVSFRFRHSLVRDASYAMLTESDRVLAHRLAAQWLARQPGSEPMAVAGHFLRADVPEDAQRWFREAAEQAFEGNELGEAVDRAEQAIACGATGELLAELRLLQAEAKIWIGNLGDAERWALHAVEHLPTGTVRWFTAVQRAITCVSLRGDIDAALRLLARAAATPPVPEARFGALLCLCEAIYGAYVVGHVDLMASLSTRLEDQVAAAEPPPAVKVQVERARINILGLAGRYDVAATAAARVVGEFEAIGDIRYAARMRAVEGQSLWVLGALTRAEQVLREAVDVARRLAAEQALSVSLISLCVVLVDLGRHAEARELTDEILVRASARADLRSAGAALMILGWLMLRDGQHAEAELQIRTSLELVSGQRHIEAYAWAVLARIQRDRGDPLAAAATATHALAISKHAGSSLHESFVWLTVVECLADVDAEAQRTALADGLARLSARLALIADPTLRRSLLRKHDWHALLEIGRQQQLVPADLQAALESVQ